MDKKIPALHIHDQLPNIELCPLTQPGPRSVGLENYDNNMHQPFHFMLGVDVLDWKTMIIKSINLFHFMKGINDPTTIP